MSALPAQAQQPGAASPPASPPPASGGAGAAAKQAPAQANDSSYSLGLMWGEQLRNNGIAPDAVSTARIAQGIHDAISGKATMSPQDRASIQALATSGIDANHRAAEKFLAENSKKPGVRTTTSGLEYQELRAGRGASPKTGDSVSVNYRGTLLNGTEFDSSYKRGEPATFEVGHVIPGWNEALALMKPGAKWKLFIPPKLAYDLRPPPGSGIQPGSMLIFEVELLSVKPAPASANPPPAAAPRAAPKPTGKAPVNPPDSPNSPAPATVTPPK
ncbi:MAG TPA: FKBP-type peptidyl-prolyl cis-trans isomerase [Steroidobacteraceae bacterium]|nr:FKBP-type peptidyl-prolyl cis-trans isomerase [Steroidobacteraceae bacterium]